MALEELVHRFGICIEVREEHLVNWLDIEVAQHVIVTMRLGEVKSQFQFIVETLRQRIDQLE